LLFGKEFESLEFCLSDKKAVKRVAGVPRNGVFRGDGYVLKAFFFYGFFLMEVLVTRSHAGFVGVFDERACL